jgi:glycosyltransferase involved in cell wall biosynthesis
MPASRFVVVSGYFPPLIGGTSTVMRNLLSAFDPKSFVVVAEKPGSFDGEHNALVPCGVRTVRAGVPPFVARRIPYGVKIARWLRFAMIPHLERLICDAVRALDAQRIIAVYPSWPFLVAAHAAHRRLGIPLITYYMDVSAEASKLPWPDHPVVKLLETKILRAADHRLVLSEGIAEDFHRRFALDSTVVPHSIDLKSASEPMPWPRENKKLIVHTGVVEGLQHEGLERIARVVEAHPELNAKLVLAGPTPKGHLLAGGFDLPCVEIMKLGDTEVRALQCAASVLVAVLPFHGEIEAYQMTAFPTKVVEYMTTGVPILAHAPGNSFFAGHALRHGYARLADSLDSTALYEALASLLRDEAANTELTARARLTVNEIYALPKVARRFAEACELDLEILKPGIANPLSI